MARELTWQEKQAIDDTVREAKNEWEAANARGDQAAKDAAHQKANDARALTEGTTHTTYSAFDPRDTAEYANNYSPGESTSRPPSWLDWDDDGQVDTWSNGGIYDSSGNRLDATDSNGYTVGGWRADPDSWDYNGPNSGGFDPSRPSFSDRYGDYYYDHSDTPYIPPKPNAPAAPPQEPPNPGPEPTFTYEKQTELVKYEYIYGIKDLKAKGTEYAEKSIYVSKPIDIPGNIMQVSLTAVEDHPVFNSASGESAERQTSVEYYVSYVENPTQEDWYAILPEDQKTVKCELLIFDNARTATLRFPALTFEPTTVYKDGIKFDDWSFTAGATQIQLLSERDAAAKYTIDYTPNAEIDDPWTVDIAQKGLKIARQVDLFPNGTNHNKTLNLTKYPYVNMETINLDGDWDANTGYRPILVTLKNANIAGPDRTTLKEVLPKSGDPTQKVYTYNITDYKTKEWKVPKAYNLAKDSLYTVFEYWHEADKLYFSETFNKSEIMTNQEFNHGNAEVQVEYDYLVSNFRVKMIFRRNGPAATSVSGLVHEYSLKFKVMK